MNKTQLRKRLKEVKSDYVPTDANGKKTLNKIIIKHYVDCLDNPNLESHLLQTGLLESIEEVNNKQLDWFQTAEDIIDALEYELTLLEEDNLVESLSGKENYQKSREYQKDVSTSMIKLPQYIAGGSIAKLNEKITFSDDARDLSVTGINTTEVTKAIVENDKQIAKGDLSSLEMMLNSQIHTLNAIFGNMVNKMATTEYTTQLETYSRIALKAQNQTRQTISILAEVKGIKKTTFIHQLNHGVNQQINNGARENLNDTANEKVIDNVARRNEATGTGSDNANSTLEISDKGRTEAISHECNETWNEVSKVERVRETVSTTK